VAGTGTGTANGAGNSGGIGGAASASATDINKAGPAAATSIALGGAGGSGDGAGHAGGTGGAAAARAKAVGTGAGARAFETGGAGGLGRNGANGGAGAVASMKNAVTGSTNLGALYLHQSATGGAGGASVGGLAGVGGAAISSLTFDDMKSATRSATITASTAATGGAGGLGLGGSNGAAGGAATASLSLTGTALVAETTAVGGAGTSIAGLATATTTVSGASGRLVALANTSLRPGRLIQTVATSASGTIVGVSMVKATAGIGGSATAFTIAPQAVALFTGAPSTGSTSAVLAGNSRIANAFGTSPVFFAMGELGGRHSTAASGSQTTRSEFIETVDLSRLASRQDLVVGLYDGEAIGSGVTAVTFNLYADGKDVLHQSFTSGAAAQTYFRNHAFDLGSLASGNPLGGAKLTLEATLTVTSSTAGSGFFGDIIIGDPPAVASTRGARQSLVQAMAGFGAGAPAIATLRAVETSIHQVLSAPRFAHWA
jgi:hypothetical protein